MESLPKICNPMPDASSGTHFTSLEKLEARPLAKRWTATPATKTSFLCRSPHGQFRDDDITACDVSRRKIGRIAPGGKSCEDTRSATESSNRSWKVLQVCSLVEDVEIDGVLVAYSNDCSAQGVQHHNGSQLLAAVMHRWSKLPRNHPHVAVFILILRVTYRCPSELLTLRKKALVPPPVPLLPCGSVVIAVSAMGVNRSPRWVGPHGPAVASVRQQALALAEV